MDVPTRFTSPWETKTQQRTPVTAALVHLAAPEPSDVLPRWDSVNAVVLGNHEIPHRFAVRIPVSLPRLWALTSASTDPVSFAS